MKQDITIGGTFTQPGFSMVSGFTEAESREYEIIVGKSGDIWLFNREDGNSLYVSGGKGSRGFGGGTVRFKLKNGLGFVELIGPWHSNQIAFLEDTGIDVSDKFTTWGCIGNERGYDENTNAWQIKDVCWFDSTETIGTFNRVEDTAQAMANEHQRPFHFYQETRGGSTFGTVKPEVK